jgi:hypothetical protein
MTWPYYVLTFCVTGFIGIFTLVIAWITIVAVRDKKGLYSLAERIIQGTIGSVLILILIGGGTALTYLMLHSCDVAQC